MDKHIDILTQLLTQQWNKNNGGDIINVDIKMESP
jgi:hypothetical protein